MLPVHILNVLQTGDVLIPELIVVCVNTKKKKKCKGKNTFVFQSDFCNLRTS